MPNLKLDLNNMLNNEKYYEELELIRLAQEPSMNYKLKIDLMKEKLESLALLNAQIGLVGQYFQDAPPVAAGVPPVDAPPVVPEAPKGQVHQGQTHGE